MGRFFLSLMMSSDQSAGSYMKMTEISLSEFEKTTDTTAFIKGKITLQEYINSLIKINAPLAERFSCYTC